MISAAFPYHKQRRRVQGLEMAYVEVGEGDPIVLLHGNPTSSYLWHNHSAEMNQVPNQSGARLPAPILEPYHVPVEREKPICWSPLYRLRHDPSPSVGRVS